MTLGEIVRRERSRLGWNALQLARAAGLSSSQISRVERGERTITFESAQRLCVAMGVSLAVFDGASATGGGVGP